MAGDDLLVAGDNGAVLDGGAGNDILLGGAADDYLFGREGNDLLIGGNGHDSLEGGAGEDLLIGRATSYDQNLQALKMLFADWQSTGSAANAFNSLSSAIVNDGMNDRLIGGDGTDWLAMLAGDCSHE
jgi:Ca2+-binding RTX toxin-like protein